MLQRLHGQLLSTPDRGVHRSAVLIVLENQADELEKLITEASQSMKPGHGLSDNAAIGPLINRDAENKMAEYVQSAVSEGATVACGGQKPSGEEYFQRVLF